MSLSVVKFLRPLQNKIDEMEKSKMIKTRVLNKLTDEMATREAEAYACPGAAEYGPGHCAHAEHKALRYAAFRRNHPNGLKPAREGRA